VLPAIKYRRAGIILAGSLLILTTLFAQRPWREFPGVEYDHFPVPPDYQTKGEWAFGRLMYRPVGAALDGFQFLGDWRLGASNWTMDYPRSDRHLARAVRRLTRIDARSVEQPVNLEEGDAYDWPWLYAVEVGHWNLTDQHAALLREYLLRGGFLMVDDFHGTEEWEVFTASMRKVLPNRPIVDLPEDDPIFSTAFDIVERVQAPGWANWSETGRTYEKDGKVPHWRGIYDDKGRVMVAICFNMDLGDSWEHADNPDYPERFSSVGIRTALNYLIYSMSH
jgi:hypothetical protein